MDKIPDGSGHLYKHLMVLGTFLALAAIYGFTVAVKAYDEKIEEKVFVAENVPVGQRQWWERAMNVRQKNIEFISRVLSAAFVVGLITAIVGGIYWYVRVQALEDDNRRLENQRLRLEFEGKAKATNPH